MHPPSRCACFVVKASHNAHCMVDPPTWLWHACGLRCVAYFNTCEHKIGGMASHRSQGRGPSCLACDRPGVLSCTTWEGLYFRSSSGH
ncbi:hypothetical protein VNO80_34971 [Phaseolus coccineus]|uniref:Uncharacterized protein n=1 Tax=Phaseolus coccineus TaxID=3886 RepID=A0AAN9KVF1_PHACN